jgi:hypothetical protein
MILFINKLRRPVEAVKGTPECRIPKGRMIYPAIYGYSEDFSMGRPMTDLRKEVTPCNDEDESVSVPSDVLKKSRPNGKMLGSDLLKKP